MECRVVTDLESLVSWAQAAGHGESLGWEQATANTVSAEPWVYTQRL